jgi:hypothetical protein
VTVPLVGPIASTSGLTVESGRQPAVTLSLEDQLLSVEVTRAVQLDKVVGEIAGALNAQLITRGNPGSVGPVKIERLSPVDVVRLISGRHSWAVEYGVGRISRIIIVAARDKSGVAHQPIVAKAPQLPSRDSPLHKASRGQTRNETAIKLRDVVRLSYRKDRAAVDELAGIVAASDDPALRGAAISALAGIGGARAAYLIGTQGITDRDAQVRVRAAEGIWRAGSANAKTKLRAAARLDPDANVRMAIRRLLRDGPPRAGEKSGPHPVRPSR